MRLKKSQIDFIESQKYRYKQRVTYKDKLQQYFIEPMDRTAGEFRGQQREQELQASVLQKSFGSKDVIQESKLESLESNPLSPPLLTRPPVSQQATYRQPPNPITINNLVLNLTVEMPVGPGDRRSSESAHYHSNLPSMKHSDLVDMEQPYPGTMQPTQREYKDLSSLILQSLSRQNLSGLDDGRRSLPALNPQQHFIHGQRMLRESFTEQQNSPDCFEPRKPCIPHIIYGRKTRHIQVRTQLGKKQAASRHTREKAKALQQLGNVLVKN